MTNEEIAAARALLEPSGLPMIKANKVLVDTRSALKKALNEIDRLRAVADAAKSLVEQRDGDGPRLLGNLINAVRALG